VPPLRDALGLGGADLGTGFAVVGVATALNSVVVWWVARRA